MNAEITSLGQVRANREWTTRPRDRDPKEQAEINQRGRALVQDAIGRVGGPAVLPSAMCPSHDDQPAGRYGGGDLRCTDCRQTERALP